MKQLELDFGEYHRMARINDPITSVLSAQEHISSGNHKKQLKRVYELVKKYPNSTAKELAYMGKINEHTPSRRLCEIERLGLIKRGGIRKCRVGGKSSLTWSSTKCTN